MPKRLSLTVVGRVIGSWLKRSREPLLITRRGEVIAALLPIAIFDEMNADVAWMQARRRLLDGDAGTWDVLRRFSAGLLSRVQAIDKLGLAGYGQLLELLGFSGLPLYRLPIEETERMAATIRALLNADTKKPESP